MKSIDLHTHTTASDGSLSPSALVDHALELGLAAIAITDHDTMSGVREALDRAGEKCGSVTVIPGIEISSYDSNFPFGLHILAYFVNKSDEELAVIIEGINSNVGYTSPGPQEAISLIEEIGGIAVLAHPKDCFISMPEMDKLIGKLSSAGLKGLECYYTTHSDEETEEFIRIAKRHGLVVTGGTDFHGQKKPDTYLGRGYGNLRIPYELLEGLRG